MDNLGKRAIMTVAATFLLATLGWCFALSKMADCGYPTVHCSFHYQSVTCTPQT